ncbi:MAG: ABC transporter ATP-binding protein [bacterium]|nr:ABC transporter ATP-binding protein [bacterium]
MESCVADLILETRNLSKDYRDGDATAHVLRAVDLTIERGDFVAVMGPSGCGKTTLLNVLGLMTPPTSAASLRLNGEDCLDLSDAQRTRLRRRSIGFVFQRFNLLGTLSARRNVELALHLRREPSDGQVERVLEQVGLSGCAHRKPGRLSIGEQQRAAIARAVVCRPALLLADEPTGNLDSDNATAVIDLFRHFHATSNMTIVMITHSLDCARSADRILRMKDGRLDA